MLPKSVTKPRLGKIEMTSVKKSIYLKIMNVRSNIIIIILNINNESRICFEILEKDAKYY